ncbi:MAG: ComEA family DNA-binding protein [Planctomycetia bacterium]
MHDLSHDLPADTALIPGRLQRLVASVAGGLLLAAFVWLAVGGPFVDHDAPPTLPAGFTTNVNTAPATELAQVPGLGPTTAARIVEHREAHGPFASIEALLDVPGIGPATLEQMRPHLRPIRAPLKTQRADP